MYAVQLRQAKPPTAPPILVSKGSEDDSLQLRELIRSLKEITVRIELLEKQIADGTARAGQSMGEIDANLETLVKASAKNAQDIQSLNRDLMRWVMSNQAAFDSIAQEFGKIRAQRGGKSNGN
jgi:hypothetical protein